MLKKALSKTEARLHCDQVNALTKDREIWLLYDKLGDIAIKTQPKLYKARKVKMNL